MRQVTQRSEPPRRIIRLLRDLVIDHDIEQRARLIQEWTEPVDAVLLDIGVWVIAVGQHDGAWLKPCIEKRAQARECCFQARSVSIHDADARLY